MKKLFSFAALALLLCVAACKQSGYKVTGTATGAEDGDTVILAIIHSMFEVDTLQTTVIKNGKFVFEGVQDTAAMRYIIWKSNNTPDLAVGTQFALENANIEILLDTTPNKVAIISGTPANEELTDLAIHEAETSNKARPIFDVLNNPDADEAAKAEAEKKLEELQQFHPAFGPDVFDDLSMISCVEKRGIPGAPAPEMVQRAIDSAREKLSH